MKSLLLLIIFSLISSCGLLDRRRFSEIMEKRDEAIMTPREHFQLTIGDSGKTHDTRREIIQSTPGNFREKKLLTQNDSLKKELHYLEQLLPEAYYEEYMRFEQKFESNTERIYFLSLKSDEERKNYLYLKGILVRPRYNETERKLAFQSGDLIPGMSKGQVLQVLGEPMQVDYAGNPEYENERWGYSTMNSTTKRFIYFENGRVEGWEHKNDF